MMEQNVIIPSSNGLHSVFLIFLTLSTVLHTKDGTSDEGATDYSCSIGFDIDNYPKREAIYYRSFIN